MRVHAEILFCTKMHSACWNSTASKINLPFRIFRRVGLETLIIDFEERFRGQQPTNKIINFTAELEGKTSNKALKKRVDPYSGSEIANK